MLAHSGLLLLLVTAIVAVNPQCNFGIELANKTHDPLLSFAAKLHKKILAANPDKNVVFSPVSIALALALVEAGAAGQTQTELKQVLAPTGFNGDVSTLYQALQHQLQIQQESAKLSVANSLFYDNDFTLKDDYLNKAKQCFETAIEKVDFSQSEAVRQKINTWCSNATAQKIPELIKQGVLSAETKAVLANAIYMKAAWQKTFNILEDRKFYQLAKADKAKTVKFMAQTGFYKYAGNDDYEMVEIPYKDAPISMIIIKAKAPNTGITAVESKFSNTPPIRLWENSRQRYVDLKLPRFTFRLTTDLATVLQQIGLSHMFDSADFSRMDPTKSIKVTKVIHEAYIKVNENGTEAAAATAVVFERTSAVFPPSEEPIPFTVDHPFLFAIVHHPTGALLFSGKVNTIEDEAH